MPSQWSQKMRRSWLALISQMAAKWLCCHRCWRRSRTARLCSAVAAKALASAAVRHSAISVMAGPSAKAKPVNRRRYSSALRDDIERAAQTIWAIASPQLAGLLCDRLGWTQDGYAAWLEDVLARALLP
jgi:hypothetical protein